MEGFQNGLDAIYPKRATLRDANVETQPRPTEEACKHPRFAFGRGATTSTLGVGNFGKSENVTPDIFVEKILRMGKEEQESRDKEMVVGHA